MRIVLTPAGSRGDFQPMLVLALGLREAGHDVRIICSPNFEAEARAFSIPVQCVGIDVQAYLHERGFDASPLRGGIELFKMGRSMVGPLIDEALPLCRGADLIVGAGAQGATPTIAEVLSIPYFYLAYTPQVIRSAVHPPFAVPMQGLPHVI